MELEWAGWGGISAFVSVVALVAALVVTYIEVRAWWLSPRGIDVDVRIGLGAQAAQGELLTFSVRAIGATALSEVSIRRIGGGAGPEKLGETIALLEARDGNIERTTWKSPGSPPLYFLVSWFERNRFGSRIQAVRFGWGSDRGLERWKPFKFPFLHELDGRWVKEKSVPGRGMRGIFWPVDESK